MPWILHYVLRVASGVIFPLGHVQQPHDREFASKMPPKSRPGTIRLRTSQACDFCHERGLRCRRNEESSACRACVEYSVDCKTNRPVRKSGRRQAHAVIVPDAYEKAKEPLEATYNTLNAGIVTRHARPKESNGHRRGFRKEWEVKR